MFVNPALILLSKIFEQARRAIGLSSRKDRASARVSLLDPGGTHCRMARGQNRARPWIWLHHRHRPWLDRFLHRRLGLHETRNLWRRILVLAGRRHPRGGNSGLHRPSVRRRPRSLAVRRTLLLLIAGLPGPPRTFDRNFAPRPRDLPGSRGLTCHVSAIASGVPAWRAAQIDPPITLRSE